MTASLRRIDTLQEALEFKEWLVQPREILAVDTETTGQQWWTPNFTRLVQFGDQESGWTISTTHWYSLIQEAFDFITEHSIPLVAHNAKFDQHAILAGGFTLPPYYLWNDTHLMHALVYPLRLHGLKPACDDIFGSSSSLLGSELKTLMKQNNWTWETIPYTVPLYSVYGGFDTVLCARLYAFLLPKIKEKYSYAYGIEMQAANVIHKIERRGIRCDLEYGQKLLDKYERDNEGLAAILAQKGITNPMANRQLITYLQENEDWEPTEFTKKGNIKLDKAVKESLDFEVITLAQEYAQNNKFMHYIDKMITSNVNDFVFPSIKTIEAVTGRMSIGSDKKEKGSSSISSIAFQQFPHEYQIRRAVIPRTDGERITAIDYDSQELRVLASLANCGGLISAIKDGLDMHIYTASKVFNIDYDSISKDDPIRTIAKMSRYLEVYGGGVEKLAKATGIPIEQAEQFKQKDAASFPEIKQFMRSVIDSGKQNYARTGRAFVKSWGGREIEVDPIKMIDGERVEFFYKLSNYIIQGSCADLLKRKLIDIDAAGLAEYVLLPVHDEVVLSVPEGQDGDEITQEIKDLMEEYDAFKVPLTCEASKQYASWGHKYVRQGEYGWDEVPNEVHSN